MCLEVFAVLTFETVSEETFSRSDFYESVPSGIRNFHGEDIIAIQAKQWKSRILFDTNVSSFKVLESNMLYLYHKFTSWKPVNMPKFSISHIHKLAV